jgi:hypothetical protein
VTHCKLITQNENFRRTTNLTIYKIYIYIYKLYIYKFYVYIKLLSLCRALIIQAQLQFQASACGDGPTVSPNASGFLVTLTTSTLQPHSFIHHGRSLILATDSVLHSKFLLSF